MVGKGTSAPPRRARATELELRVTKEVNSRSARGRAFKLRVKAPMGIDGRTLIPDRGQSLGEAPTVSGTSAAGGRGQLSVKLLYVETEWGNLALPGSTVPKVKATPLASRWGVEPRTARSARQGTECHLEGGRDRQGLCRRGRSSGCDSHGRAGLSFGVPVPPVPRIRPWLVALPDQLDSHSLHLLRVLRALKFACANLVLFRHI